MPKDPSMYENNIGFYWRMIASSAMTIGITTALTYPLDLIHTRLSSDMTPKGNRRIYNTTFDCFSSTNIDEGFKQGLYKGW